MLVTFYEKNSQILNRYPMPELLVSVGRPAIEAVSRGYIVMIPDIYYNTGIVPRRPVRRRGSPRRGRSSRWGTPTPQHIGLHGHSYGGEGAAYIGTRSRLFAAVGEGAGVTDLYTDFSQEWGWSYQNTGGSGQNGNQYYIYGQGRWGFSPWEKPDVYRDESALTPRQRGDTAHPHHARHRRPHGVVQREPQVLQRAPLQREERPSSWRIRTRAIT